MATPEPMLLFCIDHLAQWLENEVISPLRAEGFTLPQELRDLSAEITAAREQLLTHDSEESPCARDQSLLKSAVLRARRSWMEARELSAEASANPALFEALDREKRAFDAKLSEGWFLSAPERSIPGLSTWLTHESLERARATLSPQWVPRRYDRSFHQLWSSDLFVYDFKYFRDRCELRGASLGVASLDIDGLRKLNLAHGEERVNRYVMPGFLRALEAHVFGRGQVYGFGRDDFALLLPGADLQDSQQFLERLRETLRTTEYPGMDVHPRVSIGLFVVSSRCVLTLREILARVERSRRFAKTSGRDCIAVHPEGLSETECGVTSRPEDVATFTRPEGAQSLKVLSSKVPRDPS